MIAWPLALLGAVAGAIAGSFLATIILRWPQGKSILHGRSACDGCGRTLGAMELAPIVSAVVLRGRCRTCGARIDPLHWQVELGCAVIGAAVLGVLPSPGGLALALLGWLLLSLAILDWRHFWLPDALTLPLAFLGFAIGPFVNDIDWGDRLIGAGAGYLGLYAISTGYRAIRKRDGLGMGDAKLLGALGAWFGWAALPFILLIAATLGLIAAVAGGSAKATTKVPLGTFLAIAAVPGWIIATLI